jgi:hypothetical protein
MVQVAHIRIASFVSIASEFDTPTSTSATKARIAKAQDSFTIQGHASKPGHTSEKLKVMNL